MKTSNHWYLATAHGWLNRDRVAVSSPRDAWRHLERLTAERLRDDYIEMGLFLADELHVVALGAPVPRSH